MAQDPRRTAMAHFSQNEPQIENEEISKTFSMFLGT
jgi:hypothetical protein